MQRSIYPQATQRLHKALAWLVLLCGLMLASLPAFAQEALAPVPPLSGPVIDTTGTLDAATVQNLTQQALQLQQRKGSQLQVLVIPTTQPEDIAQYSVRAFEQYKVGRAKVDDGLLLVVAKDDRRVHIEVGYGLEGAIPDATASRVIQEYLVPKFRAGDFAGGITDATQTLVKLVDGEPLPAPMVKERSGESGSVLSALMMAMFAAIFINLFFRWLPKLLRFPASLAIPGFLALSASSMVFIGVMGGFIGLLVFLATMGGGRYARSSSWGNFPPSGGSWGGGGFGGGGFGGGGGGGWSGSGGMSGGGGASGSW